MNSQDKPFVERQIEALERIADTLERTAPGGSGPATGCDDAQRGVPGVGPERREGGTTDRSRDSRAVAPGEAIDVLDLMETRKKWQRRLERVRKARAKVPWIFRYGRGFGDAAIEALTLCVNDANRLIASREPDSDARRNEAAPNHDPAD